MSIEAILKQAKKTESSAGLFHEGFEGYFDQHKQRIIPKDGDFSKAPQLERREFVEYVKLQPQGFATLDANIAEFYRRFYDQWALELTEHNVGFYGVGSKLEIIENFLDHWNPPLPILIVNAFNPVAIKEIVNACVAEAVPEEIHRQWLKSVPERISSFLKYLKENNSVGLVLVVHCIDGFAIRHEKGLDALCRLASSPSIKVIATTDNLKAPALWDKNKVNELGFVWHNITSFRPAITENAYQDVTNFGKSGAKGAKSVDTILASLTDNARKLFSLALKLQCNKMAKQKMELSSLSKASNGIELSTLLDKALDRFIVSSESALKRVLDEFESHDLIKTTKSRDGKGVMFIKGSYSEIKNLRNEYSE